MRQCPFHDCQELVPPTKFCCRRHWFSLSESERLDIGVAWRYWLVGKINLSELRRRQQAVLGLRGRAAAEEVAG
jgi:hypothetical protein